MPSPDSGKPVGPWPARALAVFLVLALVNQMAVFNIPGLLLDAWVKKVHYTFANATLGLFLYAWVVHVAQAAVAAFLFFAAICWGQAALEWSVVRPVPPGILVRTALGMGFLGLAGLGLGLAGLFHPLPVLALLVGAALPSIRRMGGALAVSCRSLRYRLALDDPLKKFLAAALVVAGLASLLTALGPEGGWDPVYYHLRLPKMYSLHHRIFLVPYIYPSHYPQGIEMLYGLSWLYGGEGAAKLVNFMFWPLGGFAIMRLAASLGLAGGFTAAALALLLPLSGTLAAENYIDLGLTFIEIMALESAWRGRMVPAGLLLGFAMGSKYTGIFAVAGLLAGLMSLRRSRGSIIRACFAALLPVLPWLAKNWLFTADPVAPFWYGLFGGPEWVWGISQSAMGEVIPRLFPGGLAEKIILVVAGLWNFLKHGFFAVYIPFVIGMFPVLVFRSRSWAEAYLKVYLLVFTAACLVLAPDGRYWQPAAFVFCIPAVAWWGRIGEGGKLPAQVAGGVAVISAFFGSVYHLADMQSKYTSAFVSLGLEERALYDSRIRVPWLYYSPTASWMNRNIAAGERVAVVSDVQAYMLDRDAIFDCDACYCRWILRLVRHEPDSASLARQFRRWNVRSILYIRPKALASARGEAWTREEVRRWSGFWERYGVLDHRYGDCVVYRISRKPLPARTLLDMPGPQEWVVARMLEAGADRAARRAALREAREEGARSAILSLSYGELALDHGDPADGLAELREAVRLDSGLAPAWLALARALLRTGRVAEALQARARWEGLDPLSNERESLRLEFARARNLE